MIQTRNGQTSTRTRLAGCALSLAALGLAGCSNGMFTGTTAGGAQTVLSAAQLTGNVHGGQQPVSGATIQLYTVGTTGLKSAATALLTQPTTTDANGNFTITGLYSCASASQVYLVATGGNSGSGVNASIGLMAPLGSCATLQANAATTFLQVNEVTTVAGVYALAPFMSDYTHVGATGANPTGLVNAFASFSNLANLTTGAAGGASAPFGSVVPTSVLNSLGDIIAACINTSSASSTTCSTLYTATGATETIGATLAIAKNPGASTMTALYNLITPSAPFQPTLSSAPTDWTVAIKLNAGSTMNAPYGIAIDAAGNAWVTNTGGNNLVKLAANGNLLSLYSGGGLLGPKGIAIDKTGNVWVANPSSNSVIEFNSAGVVQSGTGFTGGGLNGPVALALDSAGNAWVANLTGNSVTVLNSAGTPTSGANGFTGSASIAGPTGVAIDASGNVLIANSQNGNVVKLTSAGAVASGSPYTDVALQGTTAVAVDASGNAWATGSTTGAAVAGAVSQFGSTGTAASSSPLSSGGLSLPSGVAVSGSTAWVTNGQSAGSLSQLTLGASAPASPAAGFGSLNAPVGVAVDASGNVWTANSGDNTVSVFIGLTAPVVTPLAANVGP